MRIPEWMKTISTFYYAQPWIIINKMYINKNFFPGAIFIPIAESFVRKYDCKDIE